MDDNNPGSVLDLSFTNTYLTISWNVLKTVIGGRHHFPILIILHRNSCLGQPFLAKKKLLVNIRQLNLPSNIGDIQKDLSNKIKNAKVGGVMI